MRGPVLTVGLEGVGIGQDLARLNQGLQLIYQGRIGHRRNSRTIHGHPENASRPGMGVSRGAYASIRPPLIELLADTRELHLLPFLSGTQVYADEQDFPRQEQDQVPSSRRRPPV